MVLRELEVPVTLHPPTNSEFRSFVWTSADLGDVVCVEKNYLERNEDIVRDTDFLIACPEGSEVMRSGTWATVRYARKKGRTIVVFWPDGHTDLECAT
jgi:arginase family enzyme